jgi:phage terminase small subunit
VNILEMYKRLSKEDKSHLTIYCIYDSIYETARNQDYELDDNTAMNLQELAYDLYLEDNGYKLSQSEIADFLTNCYVNDNSFLEKVEDIDYSDILEAISDDDYDFYKDEEMER